MIYQIVYNVEVFEEDHWRSLTLTVLLSQYCLSIYVDGKIKTWLYASKGSLIDYDAHDHACSRMTFSADRQRLFSCGINKEGESQIDEWNENEGTIKRTYQGVSNRCSSQKNQINDLPLNVNGSIVSVLLISISSWENQDMVVRFQGFSNGLWSSMLKNDL
ncbi:hypothetical protein ACFE04_028430 [Oxalis oulophora]